MKNIYRIIKYVIPYKWKATIIILFMVLTAVFSVSTLALIAPFLNLLFGKTDLVTKPVPLELNIESIIHNFNYILSDIIISYGDDGKVYALFFVGLMVILTTLLKNTFLYFSKFYMIPIRTGVVKDIRNTMYSKIVVLPLGYFSEERKASPV